MATVTELPPSETEINFCNGVYQSTQRPISWWAGTFPSLAFHTRFCKRLWRASRQAKRGLFGDHNLIAASTGVLRDLEHVGVRFKISGVENLVGLENSCVIVGNHMSTLETIVLPAIVQRSCRATFVVKSELLRMPVFRHIIGARDPIVVNRSDARADYQILMTQGLDRLARGISLIVFPQATRTRVFDPAHFNKSGIKLAGRAGVPVVPMALQTDAWHPGLFRSGFGRIDPARPVRFAFGPPVVVRGPGHDAHREVCDFVGQKIQSWRLEDS